MVTKVAFIELKMQKNIKIEKFYYTLKYMFYILIYFKMMSKPNV